MAVTAAVATTVTAGASIASARQQQIAAERQNRAQRRARAVERRTAEIQNQRARNRAIAEQRILTERNIALGAAAGTSTASTLAGVVASGAADVSSAIANQNTLLAGNVAQSSILQRGAERAAQSLNRANQFGALAQTSGSVANVAGPINFRSNPSTTGQ